MSRVKLYIQYVSASKSCLKMAQNINCLDHARQRLYVCFIDKYGNEESGIAGGLLKNLDKSQ